MLRIARHSTKTSPTAAALAEQLAAFDAVALSESKKALERIPAFITDWQEAMDHGQMVNLTIRSKTTAQAEGSARFAAGIGKVDILEDDVGLLYAIDPWLRAVPSLVLAVHLLFEKVRGVCRASTGNMGHVMRDLQQCMSGTVLGM